MAVVTAAMAVVVTAAMVVATGAMEVVTVVMGETGATVVATRVVVVVEDTIETGKDLVPFIFSFFFLYFITLCQSDLDLIGKSCLSVLRSGVPVMETEAAPTETTMRDIVVRIKMFFRPSP